MIEKDKSLIKNKESIISRIINKIKKIFKKENKSELPPNEAVQEIEKIDFNNHEETPNEVTSQEPEKHFSKNSEAEEKYREIKERFFEKYNSYKSGELSEDDLSPSEIIMATSMLEEELKVNKVNSIKETKNLNEIEEKIKKIEKRVSANS